jgi:hypothetical protein
MQNRDVVRFCKGWQSRLLRRLLVPTVNLAVRRGR